MNSKPKHIDHIILLIVVALMGLGLIMVYSASSVTSLTIRDDGLYYFKRQLAWVITGMLAITGFVHFPYKKLESIAVPLLGFSIFLLILVLMPGIARDIGGAKRWLRFGPFGFQPSEFTKICFIIFMAHSISSKQDNIKSFLKGLLPDLLISTLVFYLIFKGPNLSTASLIIGTYIIMYFLGNGSVLNISMLLLGGSIMLVSLIFHAGYRIRRLDAFLNPWENASTSAYHIIQSLIAIGTGGVWGLGLGGSRQKVFILPERHTDFIYAIICEELGLVGALLVLFLFFVLVWRGMYVALRAPDFFGFMLASGITGILSLQVIVNIAVVVGLIPTTGITLPFISYGGSSLVFSAVGIGILLNISKYSTSSPIFSEYTNIPFSRQFKKPTKSKLTKRR